MAAASFIAAIPMIGDAIGGSAKLGLKGTCLGSKIIFGSKAIAALGGFGLSLGQIYNNSKALAERLNQNGWKWDDESKALAGSIGINAIFALFSAKNAGDNINGFTTSQCFVAGTLVLTIEDSKAIEEIKAGDLVYSTDPETGESEYKEVVRAFREESDVIIHIFVNGEEIETTPQHPFWVEDEWVSAKDLREGDVLTLADGTTATITKTYGEQFDDPVIVYNFEVKDYHTYYVTDIGVLVHNANKYTTGNVKNSNGKDDREYTYANGTYEKADYHSNQTTGRKNPAPQDGQFALDNSVPVNSSTTPRRVGLDTNGDFVVFDETTPGVYHGHLRNWNNSGSNQGLSSPMKNALYKAGYIKNPKGNNTKLTDIAMKLLTGK